MQDMIARIRGRLFAAKCKLLRRNITVGKNLRLYVKLDLVDVGRVILGDNCQIRGMAGSRHKFVCLASLDPEAEVSIGNNAILCAARITAKFGVTIGDDVIIEDASILDTDFHTLDKSRDIPQDENATRCTIRIGRRVGIGAQSVILKGVEIGDDCLIAPSSVVNKSIRPGHFAQGNPVTSVPRGKEHI